MAFFRLPELQPKIEAPPRPVKDSGVSVRERPKTRTASTYRLKSIQPSTCKVSGFRFSIYVRKTNLSRILDRRFSQFQI